MFTRQRFCSINHRIYTRWCHDSSKPKIFTQSVWKLVRVNVHLLVGGEITEERHGAAGCQSKDLYRAVAAAETDIGRHGMHDKSWWTGGTRLKKQENTLNRAEGDVHIRDSTSMSFTYTMINIFILKKKSFMIIFTQRLHYNNIWRMTTVDCGPVNLWQTRYAPRSACWVSEGLRGQGSVLFFFLTFMWSGLALGRWRTESLAPPSLVAINGCNLYPCKAVAVFKFHLFYPNEWWTLVQCTVEQY